MGQGDECSRLLPVHVTLPITESDTSENGGMFPMMPTATTTISRINFVRSSDQIISGGAIDPWLTSQIYPPPSAPMPQPQAVAVASFPGVSISRRATTAVDVAAGHLFSLAISGKWGAGIPVFIAMPSSQRFAK